MKARPSWIILLVIAVLFMSAYSTPTSSGQDDPAENELLRLLGYVPDTPGNRAWLTFGDMAAWHSSWDVPRVDNVEELDNLARDPRAYWMFIMPGQTLASDSLGVQYILQGDQRDFYGFDFFQVDRVIDAGQPPEGVTFVEHHADSAQIAARLLENGYTATELENGWMLYSILDDYEMNLAAELPRVGQFGQRNRIALRDNQMIIARATDNVLRVVETESDQPALAADPIYAAVVKAFDDPAFGDKGQLVGAVLLPGLEFAGDPVLMMLGEQATPETVEALRERLGLNDPQNRIPPFWVAAFTTHHTPGASYLTVAVALLGDADPQHVADVIANRIKDYVSIRYKMPLDDRWTFDQAVGVTVDNVPVAMVTMRIDDPPPAPEGERARAGLLSWFDLILARDTGFLAFGEPGE